VPKIKMEGRSWIAKQSMTFYVKFTCGAYCILSVIGKFCYNNYNKQSEGKYSEEYNGRYAL